MTGYQIKFLEEKNSRRTIADAMDVIRSRSQHWPDGTVRILARPLRLPSRQTVQLICVVYDSPLSCLGCVVALPSAVGCLVTDVANSKRQQIDACLLDGATIEPDEAVRLTSGQIVRAVEVIPALLPFEPSAMDWRIVRSAIDSLGWARLCYRNPVEHSSVPERYAIPCGRILDFGALSRLEHRLRRPLPPLKEICWKIREHDKGLASVSDQKIAKALADFGIRIPSARPRRLATLLT